MLKRVTVSFLCLVLFASLSFAQSKKLVEQKAQKVNEEEVKINPNASNEFHPLKKVEPQVLFYTDYDYPANQSMTKMLEMYDLDGDGVLDPLMVGMKRIDGGTRGVQMAVGLGGEYTDFLLSDPTIYTGWGTIQVAKDGPWAGNALVMGHGGGNSWFWTVDLTEFSVDEVSDSLLPGNFPDFVYLDDGTVFVTNNYGILYQTSASDLTNLTPLGSFDQAKATDWPSEYPLRRSANGEHLLHYGSFPVNGTGVDGIEQDSSDYVQIDYSHDGGATWTYHEDIAYEGHTALANRPGYLPLYENFGQVNGNIANDGTIHITDNGFGYAIYGQDTLIGFPAVYWNSRDREWIAFTDEVVDTNLLSADSYTYPGNGIGNSYPSPVISENGERVVILWQGPEYSQEPYLEENLNVTEATTENPESVYYTDLYYVYSGDGGRTFSEPMKVPGASEQMVQESYPVPYQFLVEDETDMVTVHYVYMVDAVPGTSIFSTPQNSASNESYWAYDSFTVEIPVGVDDDETVVNNYKLEQNYPNPFNPTTTIEYTLKEKNFVSLKVYDVLGKEVATLVNGIQESGVNEITFDASDLASGMYIYKLEAGNFSSAKKMMLLK